MLECFVYCFLKAFVEILDWQGLGEFGWAFGGPSTKIWLIEGGPHTYLHVDCFLKVLEGIPCFKQLEITKLYKNNPQVIK